MNAQFVEVPTPKPSVHRSNLTIQPQNHHSTNQTKISPKNTNSQPNLPTPIKPNTLSKWLWGYANKITIINGFTQGFHLHIKGQPEQITKHSHPSALALFDVVQAKIEKEVNLGRTAGPFKSPPFLNFTTSPLGAVPKKDPGEFRIIHDLSYPKNNSVNPCISKEDSAVSYETLTVSFGFSSKWDRGPLLRKPT